MKHLLLAFVLIGFAVPAFSIDEGQSFEDPDMQARYERIISEVRCLVCQNQTIRDSNVFLAADLRREIRRLLTEGKTDTEIADFLVSRYGEFVLYRPPMSGKTLILWLAPLLLIGLGFVIVFRVIRDRMGRPIEDDADEVSG